MSLELKIESRPDLHSFRHEAMATDLQLFLGGVDASYARQASQVFFERVDDIEGKLSLYQETSDVSRINRLGAGEDTIVSDECIKCLEASLYAADLTGGLFHPFLGMEALRVKGKVPRFLQSALERQGVVEEQHFVEVDPRSRRILKRSDTALLDFGGIGKGFALDLAIEELEDWEVPLIMASFGGSTLLFRSSPEASPWEGSLGDRSLRPFSNGAISSSGVGFQGEHIVSARGQESPLRWRRTFARCGTARLADALTTGAMLMTEDRLEAMCRETENIAIAADSDESSTWGIENFCEWREA